MTNCTHRHIEYFPDEWADHWRCTDCGVEFGPAAELLADRDSGGLSAFADDMRLLARIGRITRTSHD